LPDQFVASRAIISSHSCAVRSANGPANLDLAKGNMKSYLDYVKLAERELRAMERIIRDDFANLAESDWERKDPFSRSGL